MPEYSTIPAARQQNASEDITWGVDVSAELTGMQTPTAPTGVLTDLSTLPASNVTLADAASITGNVVNQRIRANVLTAGHRYILEFGYTIAGNVLVSELKLVCPAPSAS